MRIRSDVDVGFDSASHLQNLHLHPTILLIIISLRLSLSLSLSLSLCHALSELRVEDKFEVMGPNP